MNGGSVAGGLGASNGLAAGSGIFLQNATVEFAPDLNQTQIVSDTIADDFGNPGSAGGRVVKSGAGLVRLDGANTYQGGTVVLDGTLWAGGASALPQNTAFTVDGGKLQLDYDLTMSQLSGLGGSVSVYRTLTVDQSASSIFAGDITGTGSFSKTGTGTLVLSGNNTYDGPTTVAGGTLVVNGVISGSTSVLAGATLGGSGVLGNTQVLAGGVLAAGNNALTVSDALRFASGSTYRVEVFGDGSSGMVSARTADIGGGTVEVVALDPGTSYHIGQTYRILDTTDGRAGTFEAVSTNAAFINPVLIYSASAVDLMITAGKSFQSVAQSSNQNNAAAALQQFDQTPGSDALAVYNNLLMLSDDEARRAFDLASGEIHSSGQQVIGQSLALFSGVLGSAGTAGGQMQIAPLAYGPAPGSAAAGLMAIDAAEKDTPEAEHYLWLTPLAGRGVVNTDGNGAELAWWTAGLAGGYEGRTTLAGGQAQFGVGLGYLASGGTVDDRLSRLDGQGGYAGAYGGWTDGALSLKGALAYGADHIDTSRRITFGGIDRTATAGYWTHSLDASLEAGYDLAVTNGLVVTPTARLEAAVSHHGAVTETGAGALNTTIAAATDWQVNTGLGAAIAQSFALNDGGQVTLRGKALWVHGFGDTSSGQIVAFDGGGDPFVVRGPGQNRDQLRISAGIEFQPLNGLTASLDYTGQFAAGQQSHIGQLGLKARF